MILIVISVPYCLQLSYIEYKLAYYITKTFITIPFYLYNYLYQYSITNLKLPMMCKLRVG